MNGKKRKNGFGIVDKLYSRYFLGWWPPWIVQLIFTFIVVFTIQTFLSWNAEWRGREHIGHWQNWWSSASYIFFLLLNIDEKQSNKIVRLIYSEIIFAGINNLCVDWARQGWEDLDCYFEVCRDDFPHLSLVVRVSMLSWQSVHQTIPSHSS